MIVIDASSLARYILLEPGWERIEEFIREKRPCIPGIRVD
ncbi:hypothetical protein J2747_001636 [Thermococcus stetteri]|nr:hypothetical protein [Thermococcus stetteri]